MTEDEAKTKACCGPLQSSAPDVAISSCIGSRCMAWRWKSNFIVLADFHPNKTLNELRAIADGYCGLVGKP